MMERWKKTIPGKYVIVLLILFFFFAASGAIMSFAKTDHTEPMKIGIILPPQHMQVAVAAEQCLGLKAACEAMGMELIMQDNSNLMELDKDIQTLSNQGAGMIFLSNPFYVQQAKNIVEGFPNIAFATSTPKEYARNMTGYFIRMFTGRYIAGAVAGLMTKTNVLGYYALAPSDEVRSDVNAFTLGAQAMNPEVRVILAYGNGVFTPEHMEDVTTRAIREKNIDIITYQFDEKFVEQVAEKEGIDYIGAFTPSKSESPQHLFDVCISWEEYFKDMLRSYGKGELNYVDNHWTGMESGTVYMTPYSEKVTPEIREKVNQLKWRLDSGEFIFTGPLYDNQGKLRVEKDDIVPDSAMFSNMRWYVKGVELFE